MIRALLAALIVALPYCPQSGEGPGTARYSVPVEVLDRGRDCRTPLDGSGRAEPVLLVHGTGVTRERNWSIGYWPALDEAGFEVCWVALPDGAFNDIQISAEYVARAVETMATESSEDVDVIGHSQGGLAARWAAHYFPSGAEVDDLVTFAAPNHGTTRVERALAEDGRCSEACWQMAPGSRFLEALNSGDETPGDISYTSLYTAVDEAVTPPASARLEGAANIRLQDVCPARPVEHALMAVDALTWELTLDALTRPGPAVAGRIDGATCFRLALPGARLELAGEPADRSNVVPATAEPPLRRYAT